MIALAGGLAGVGATSSLVGIALAVLAIAYNGLLDGSPGGQTIGKRLLKIRVVSDETGGPIGNERGIARAAVVTGARLAGAVPFLALLALVGLILDGLWPLWDKRRQTWHDKAVRSVVVVA